MAADEVLLDDAAAGLATLRFYAWVEPTLSLGYFQPHQSTRNPDLASLPWLRRATGGAGIVHHHELTYSLALPSGAAWHPLGRVWMTWMHERIRGTLASFGIGAELCVQERNRGAILCFLHPTPGDLLVGGYKVAGSAQRRQRGALLQHGSILLRQSPFTPTLPGLADLSPGEISSEALRSSLIRAFAEATGWTLALTSWRDPERARISDWIATRYAATVWNEKR